MLRISMLKLDGLCKQAKQMQDEHWMDEIGCQKHEMRNDGITISGMD